MYRNSIHWLGPLLAVFVAQIAVTFLSRLAPTLAPALAGNLRWNVSEIGLLSSIVAAGSVLFMLGGLPLVLRAGPVRSLQAGLLVGAAGTVLYAVPHSAGPIVGSVLIGLAAGPQASAGSDVLRRHAPAGSHNLVFSLKQAGVPLGGVLAGLLLPPIVDSAGLTTTFMLCAGLALATLASIQPLQRRLDAGRDRAQSTHPRLLLSLTNLRRPLRALAQDPALRRVAAVGAFLAVGQGMWFIYLVSFLVLEMRLSLTVAGALFALMQIVSVVARPAMGLLADRSSASAVLKFLCIASTITTVALALLTPQWPHWALLTLLVTAGFTVSSWNGVQLAQIAYFARPETVAESTAGATLLVFLSSIVAPVVFGSIVALGGDFRIGFWVAAICTLAALVPLSRLPRQSARTA